MTWLPHDIPAERGVFCNRTLNLRSIQAIGYDMDYTLIHYNVNEWEGRAFFHLKQKLLEQGWPVEDVKFDPTQVIRGLVIDREHGTILKVNRFGYVKQAIYGTNTYDFDLLRKTYRRTLVDLSESRYYFLNTLFSLSEASMYMQLVDRLHARQLPEMMNYSDLLTHLRRTLDLAHMEGQLKADIMADPKKYVELDEEMPRTLLDQKESGKKLLLITNSEWEYTRVMMTYAFDRYLPKSMTWRDLFEFVVVSSRKPAFFSEQAPMFKIINEKGDLSPCPAGPTEPGLYLGGHARLLEQYLKVHGDQILYIGDHIFSDVNISKSIQRWRTALIVRELEDEIIALQLSKNLQDKIADIMYRKEALEYRLFQSRLALQRQKHGHSIESFGDLPTSLEDEIETLQQQIRDLDQQIQPMVTQDGKHFNGNWGYLMWAGNDNSHLSHQIAKYADVYTSRVSNFQPYTPYAYFRSPRGTPPHDLSQIYQISPVPHRADTFPSHEKTTST